MPEAPIAFPLQWPVGYARTPAHKRRDSSFTSHGQRLTVAVALSRLQAQVDLLGGRLPILSSNVELRLDGMPRSGLPEPQDPGVALYFQLRGKPTCMPCDSFRKVADNIGAIAHHIDAVRRIERYGVASVEQMFTGFQAIRGTGPKPWREVLGVPEGKRVDRPWINDRRRELAVKFHPDQGGSEILMAEVNAAADEALREITQ